MKLMVGAKMYQKVDRTRRMPFEELERRRKKIIKFKSLLIDNNFDDIFNEVEFLSNDFSKLLDLAGDKYSLKFDFWFKYSKKELDEFKAFQLGANSSITVNNDVTYLSQSRFDKLDSLCAIRGKVNWKPGKITLISQDHYSIPNDVYDLLLESNLTGYKTEQIYNISTKQFENAYCLYATSCMPERVQDKLNINEQNGLLIYEKNILDDIRDFNFVANDSCRSELIISQKTRKFILENKLKGVLFNPILGIETERFDEYNELVKEFSKTVLQYNIDHIIGTLGLEINPMDLLDGVL